MPFLNQPVGDRQTRAALFLFWAMAAIVGTALMFEHWGGYIPCKLCLEQRLPYYLGMPAMVVAGYGAGLEWPACVRRGALLTGGVLMAYGMLLGAYHAGVEWALWAGPADCVAVAGAPETGGKGVLDAIDAFVPPSCDKAAWRMFGLSFAGWNVPVSLVLAVIALRSAIGARSE